MANFFSNEKLAALQANYQPIEFGAPVTTKRRGRGGSATSFISEAGGTGGALAGAATGAAIGSIVPGIGTAIGGILGAGIGGFAGGTGGRLAENKIRDDEYRIGDALKEGTISGVLGAGPGGLVKGLKGISGMSLGAAGKTAPTSLSNALIQSSDDVAGAVGQVAKEPLKTSATGRMGDLSSTLLSQQYGTIGKNIARSVDAKGAITKLANAGITKSKDVDRISSAITGGNGIVDNLVAKSIQGATTVPTVGVKKVFNEAVADIGLVGKELKSVAAVVDGKLGALGDNADPGQVMQTVRQLEKRIADLKGAGGNYKNVTAETSEKAAVLTKVKNELRDSLYGAAGANKNLNNILTPEARLQLVKLQPNNTQWTKYVDESIMSSKTVGDLRSSIKPFVDMSRVIKEGDTNLLTYGGRVGDAFKSGGNIASSLLAGTAAAVQPGASRLAGAALNRVAAKDITGVPLAGQGAKSIAGRVGVVGGLGEAAGSTLSATRAAVPAFAIGDRSNPAGDDPTQDPSLYNALSGASKPQTGTNDFSGLLAGANGQEQSGQQQDSGMAGLGGNQQPQGSPYSRDNLMADIQRDPKNAKQYISYYKELDGIFAATKEEGALNAQSKSSLATSANGIGTLNQLEQLFASTGGGSGKVGGLLANTLSKVGANDNVASYNDLSASASTQIAKAINGGGQVSDADAAVIIRALPRTTDSPAVARAKFAALKERLENSRQNTLLYGGGVETQQVTQGAF